MQDIQDVLLKAIQEGISRGVKDTITSNYNNPFTKVIASVIEGNDSKLRTMLADSLNSAVGDPAFSEEIRGAVRATLAKTLVARFGGELEKQVNALKSDPTTRARITVAIEEIVKSKA